MSRKTPSRSPDVEALLPSLLPRVLLLPGEDPTLLESLRAALLLELAPRSPYERLLAEDLATLEWEIYRQRRLRDELIRAQVRDLTKVVLSANETKDGRLSVEEAAELASDLLRPDAKSAGVACQALERCGVTLGEIVARAHSRVSETVELHEKQISSLETRRRRMREDYDRLRAVLAHLVEDAEVLE